MFVLPSLSEEQASVIEAIKTNHNVKVSGVAGCGKTTTILGICAAFTQYKVLVLTYNARLKLETREKVEKLQLQNTEVHSYHAMCVRYYTRQGAKDSGIIHTIEQNTPPKSTLEYDLIILDECQDMTKCYFDFVKKIIHDCQTSKMQICVFGDEKQNIFDFKGADERYLTYSNSIFNYTSKLSNDWKEVSVSTTFRMTKQVTHFVNKYLVGYDKITSNKSGKNVRYLYINMYKHLRLIYEEVKYYLNIGYKYEDIFILAPSIKKTGGISPLIKLENMLVHSDIPCFAPVSDEAKIDEDVIDGKIVFSTFHQVKGLERPVVIIFNFDYSYFKYYGRNLEDTDKCPNIMYVACTRATERMTVIHSSEHKALLPSFTYDNIITDKYIDVIGGIISKEQFGEISSNIQNKIQIQVTELIRFLDPCVIVNCIKYIEFITLANYEDRINLPQKTSVARSKSNNDTTKTDTTIKESTEIVYDINGYALPTYFEITQFGRCSLLNAIVTKGLDTKQLQNYNKIYSKFAEDKQISIKYLLYLATLYDSTLNGYKHRIKQIASYDWLTEEHLSKSNYILKSNVGDYMTSDDMLFEHPIKGVRFLNTQYYLNGCVDILDLKQKILWEIKCTTTTDNEHVIQLALYAWMLYTQGKLEFTYKLLNVCCNEQVQLLYNHEKITDMVEYIIREKYQRKKRLTDEEFITICIN
jgi:hypothetical protein